MSAQIERCSHPDCRQASRGVIIQVATGQTWGVCFADAHAWWIHLQTGAAAEKTPAQVRR